MRAGFKVQSASDQSSYCSTSDLTLRSMTLSVSRYSLPVLCCAALQGRSLL
jgi:hypothetical protein